MADSNTTESILFEIKIGAEQFKAEQKQIRDSLGQIVLQTEKTRAAQKALDDARKAGKVTDAEYSARAVRLREELTEPAGQPAAAYQGVGARAESLWQCGGEH